MTRMTGYAAIHQTLNGIKAQVYQVQNETFGSHSLQKGSATFAASGSTMTPSMAAICNRAGWKMGGTRDKYIKFENAGDQYLGRVVTGLDALSPAFASTPPFLDASNDMEKKKVDDFIKSRLENSHKISDKLFVLYNIK